MAVAVAFPDTVPGPDLTVSATAYLTWLKCPERALARFEGVYDEGTVATFRGIVAHRVFARHLNEGPIADTELAQVCREEIGKGLNEAMVGIGLKPSGLANVIEEVRVLYDRFRRVPVDGLRHVEVQIDEEVAPGVRLRGIVDAVFEESGHAKAIRLTDWKTGSLGEASHQLAFYALLWSLAKGEVPRRLEALSVASGERLEEHPTQASLAETAGKVATLVGEVRSAMEGETRLPRVGGPWCRSCPVLAGCGEGAAAIAVLGT